MLDLLAVDEVEAIKRAVRAEAYLMGGIFEFCESPELFSGDSTIHVVGDEVVDLVVGHSADDNIVIVGFPVTAGDDEVEPLFGYVGKLEDIQAVRKTNRVGVHARGVEPTRPALGLLAQYRAVKAGTKILGVASNANLGPFDLAATAMKDCQCHSLSIAWRRL